MAGRVFASEQEEWMRQVELGLRESRSPASSGAPAAFQKMLDA
jgi:hypothetical protein